jgi:hypothetical protein
MPGADGKFVRENTDPVSTLPLPAPPHLLRADHHHQVLLPLQQPPPQQQQTHLWLYPIITPVKGEMKTNISDGLSVSELYF